MKTTRKQKMEIACEVAPLGSTSLGTDDIPSRVLLAPWGNVESTNGSFVVDEAAALQAIEAFTEHGTDLPIDYEHQTLGGTYASPSGKAPAAGWIKHLTAEAGVGLVAKIEWTHQAREMLAAKEYRYLSPVAIVRKSDRKLVGIHSAALTNKPAIVGMDPIVNRASLNANVPDQSPADAAPIDRLRIALDLPSDAHPEHVLFAAGERLSTLTRDADNRRTEERVLEAMRAGKLVEAQRAWAEALIQREEDLFDEWYRTAPVIVHTGLTSPPEKNAGKKHRHHAVAARARTEYRDDRVLQRLTTEEAYIADAVREAAA